MLTQGAERILLEGNAPPFPHALVMVACNVSGMAKEAAFRALGHTPIEAVLEPDILAGIGVDWTGRVQALPAALVRPESTSELVALLRVLNAEQVPMGIQGGRTSLVAGAVPPQDGVAVSTERLNAIVEVDPVSQSAIVEAGVSLAALARAARAHGLEPGIDLASRDSATIGGMVATNAGGERVVRFGTFGQQVLGVEAVTGTGALLGDLRRPPKNNVGPDLARILIGAEGTLGIVTRVRVALFPVPATRIAVLAGFGDLAGLVAAWVDLAPSLAPWIESAEFMRREDLEQAGLSVPVPGDVLLLIGLRSAEAEPSELFARLEGLGDAAVAIEDSQRSRLWRLRDELPLVASRFGEVVKLDLGVWPTRLPELAEVLGRTIATFGGVRAWTLFGHVPEGTAHLNLALEPGADDGALVTSLLERTLGLGGQIASEHGIGRTKRAWVRRARSEEELRLLVVLKRTLDPRGILNPGVLLPEEMVVT